MSGGCFLQKSVQSQIVLKFRRECANIKQVKNSQIQEVLLVENAPNIILFWCFFIAIFILMIASMIAATVFVKKRKGQGSEKLRFAGKLCFALSAICAVPIILVIGYALYLYI